MASITIPNFQSTYNVELGAPFVMTPSVSGGNSGTNTYANPTLGIWAIEGTFPPGLLFDPRTGTLTGYPTERGNFGNLRLRFVNYCADAMGSNPPVSGASTLVLNEGKNLIVNGASVKLFNLYGTYPLQGLAEGEVYTVTREGTGMADYVFVKRLGQLVTSFATWAGAALTHPSVSPVYSATFAINVTGEGTVITVPSPYHPDFDFPITWDTRSGDVSAEVYGVVAPSEAQAAEEPVAATLRSSLIVPAKLHDKYRWRFTLRVGADPDFYTTPTQLQIVLWDPDNGDPIVVASGEPQLLDLGTALWYALVVEFTEDLFGHLVTRAGGFPDRLFDAEVRAVLYNGRTKASRTFRVWLEDSVQIAA